MSTDNHEYFDFRSEEELPEEYSGKKIDCPHCNRPVAAESLFCLYCGEALSPERKSSWLAVVAVLVLIALLLWLIF